eukprot:scaffold16241_cov40-Cyclotella_meneghiniana.AAC.1
MSIMNGEAWLRSELISVERAASRGSRQDGTNGICWSDLAEYLWQNPQWMKKNEEEKLLETAEQVYAKFKDKDKNGLNNTNLKALIKFVVALEACEDDDGN